MVKPLGKSSTVVLSIRLLPEQKELIERAARLVGKPPSTWGREVWLEAAQAFFPRGLEASGAGEK